MTLTSLTSLAASATCVCFAAFLGVAKSTMGNSIANGDVCRDYRWRYAAKHKPSTASGGGAAGLAREDKTVGRVNNAQEPGLREGAATFSSERSALKAPEAPAMQVMQSCSDLRCRGLSDRVQCVFGLFSQVPAPIERAAGKRISIPPVQLKSSLLRAPGPGVEDTQQHQLQLRRWPERDEAGGKQTREGEEVEARPGEADTQVDKPAVTADAAGAAGAEGGEGGEEGGGGGEGVPSCDGQSTKDGCDTGARVQEEDRSHAGVEEQGQGKQATEEGGQ